MAARDELERESQRRLRIVRGDRFTRMRDHAMAREAPDSALLIWVLEGHGFGEADGVRTSAGPGDLLAFAHGVPHAYGSRPGDRWTILWVHFTGAWADLWVDRLRRGGGAVVPIGMDPATIEAWEHLLRLTAGVRRGSLRPDAALHDLLARLDDRVAAWVGGVRDDEALSAVVEHVHAHLTEAITVDQLAELVSLSPSQLTRRFREALGQPPLRYIIEARMRRARLLLTETTLPVKRVAALVGYDDPYYFSRLFRQTVGRSPSSLRGGGARRAGGSSDQT